MSALDSHLAGRGSSSTGRRSVYGADEPSRAEVDFHHRSKIEATPGATLHQVIFTFRARSSSELIARTRSISSWRSSSVRP